MFIYLYIINMDIFEQLKGYDGLYEINRNGEIKTIKRKGTDERILKPYIDQGYKKFCLYKDGKGKKYGLHRLLGLQFIPNIENKICIDHIDRNKLNNNIENLRWASYSENNSNKDINGSIYIDKCKKYKDIEYKYFKVCYKNIKKRFKNKEDAEKFLEECKITHIKI